MLRCTHKPSADALRVFSIKPFSQSAIHRTGRFITLPCLFHFFIHRHVAAIKTSTQLYHLTKKALQPFWGRRAFDFSRKPAFTLRPILAIDSFLAAEIDLLRDRGGLLSAARARDGFRRRRLQVPMMKVHAGHYSFRFATTAFSFFWGSLHTRPTMRNIAGWLNEVKAIFIAVKHFYCGSECLIKSN